MAALCCFSPSNSRLNDVCFLKCPSAHCCCTEQSFICGPLSKFCHSLASHLGGDPESRKGRSVCLNYLIFFSFLYDFAVSCPRKDEKQLLASAPFLFISHIIDIQHRKTNNKTYSNRSQSNAAQILYSVTAIYFSCLAWVRV